MVLMCWCLFELLTDSTCISTGTDWQTPSAAAAARSEAAPLRGWEVGGAEEQRDWVEPFAGEGGGGGCLEFWHFYNV